MKHLKPYNESTHSQKDIEEICYDITDTKGFIFLLGFDNGKWKIIIKQKMRGMSDRFPGFLIDDEVKGVLQRIVDYLGNKFDAIWLSSQQEVKWQVFSKDDWKDGRYLPQNTVVDCIRIFLAKGEQI